MIWLLIEDKMETKKGAILECVRIQARYVISGHWGLVVLTYRGIQETIDKKNGYTSEFKSAVGTPVQRVGRSS